MKAGQWNVWKWICREELDFKTIYAPEIKTENG